MFASFAGRFPILYGHSGHLSIGHNLTSFFSPQLQSRHFALIAFIGVIFVMRFPPLSIDLSFTLSLLALSV
jgi:hypothetical protein